MSRSHPARSCSAGAEKAAAGPGRPKDLSKRAAILNAAQTLFMVDGYTGVSMDQIASEAGVSKLTVYSHFGDKEALFAEAMRQRCEELLPLGLFSTPNEGDLRLVLLDIARAVFDLVGSDEAISLQRMMLTPGQADESLRQTFWKAGPQRIHEAFANFLGARADSGELEISNLCRASHQFFNLIKGELHSRMLCGLCARPDPAELSEHLEATVDFFLRAYAPRSSQS